MTKSIKAMNQKKDNQCVRHVLIFFPLVPFDTEAIFFLRLVDAFSFSTLVCYEDTDAHMARGLNRFSSLCMMRTFRQTGN